MQKKKRNTKTNSDCNAEKAAAPETGTCLNGLYRFLVPYLWGETEKILAGSVVRTK